MHVKTRKPYYLGGSPLEACAFKVPCRPWKHEEVILWRGTHSDFPGLGSYLPGSFLALGPGKHKVGIRKFCVSGGRVIGT